MKTFKIPFWIKLTAMCIFYFLLVYYGFVFAGLYALNGK